MNTDIRLACTFPDHPKTIQLLELVGPAGAWALIVLWTWTALHRPEGRLDGMSDAQIERAAQWSGGAGKLVEALLESGFMECDRNARRIHDWKHWQGWASHAEQRSRAAKKAADARWIRARKTASDSQNNATRNASAYATRNAPSPYPFPYPSPKNRKDAPPVGPNESLPLVKHVDEDLAGVPLQDRCQNCFRARAVEGKFCKPCLVLKEAQ